MVVWAQKIFGGPVISPERRATLASRPSAPMYPATAGQAAAGGTAAIETPISPTTALRPPQPKSPRKQPQKRSAAAELVQAAQQPGSVGRSRLTEMLTEVCLESGRTLSERERDIFFDILRHLIHQIEKRVRKSVAERLAHRTDVPQDLILELANDEIEVAYPILVNSLLLEDTDLIELILHKTDRHRIAIARRSEISLSVSETLIDNGNEGVILALLENNGAEIGSDSMARLVEESLEVESYREPLLERHEMRPELARRMYTWVGEALREHIREQFAVTGDEVEDAISVAIAEAVDYDEFPDDLEEIDLEQYASTPNFHPTTPMLLHALEDGDIYRFEEMFRDMSNLGPSLVTRLLYDSGSEALAIAFKAIGVDRASFGQIFCYLRGSRPYESFTASPMYEKAMMHFDEIDMASAGRVLDSWRIDPDENHARSTTH